jgi:hypothetical protein
MDFNTSASAFARAILVLSLADFTAEHPTILRAFVPTLSSGLCQLTLAESSYAIPGTTTFCGVRQIDGVYGVVVAIFLPEVPPAESLWVVNIRQEKAKGYGDPIPYPGD